VRARCRDKAAPDRTGEAGGCRAAPSSASTWALFAEVGAARARNETTKRRRLRQHETNKLARSAR
jgi:hypothetical protein